MMVETSSTIEPTKLCRRHWLTAIIRLPYRRRFHGELCVDGIHRLLTTRHATASEAGLAETVARRGVAAGLSYQHCTDRSFGAVGRSWRFHTPGIDRGRPPILRRVLLALIKARLQAIGETIERLEAELSCQRRRQILQRSYQSAGPSCARVMDSTKFRPSPSR